MVGAVEHWGRGEALDPADMNHPVIQALSNEIVAVIRDLVRMNPLFREHTQYFTSRVDMSDPYKLADFAASLTTAEGPELQAVLEERHAKERLHKAEAGAMQPRPPRCRGWRGRERERQRQRQRELAHVTVSLLCFASLCFALLCVAVHCSALLCIAL